MRGIVKNFIIFLIVFLIFAGLLSLWRSPLSKPKNIGLGELVTQIENDEVKQIQVNDNVLNIVLKDGAKETSRKEGSSSLSTVLKDYGLAPEKLKATDIEIKDNGGTMFWLGTILPFLIPFLLIGVFIYFMMRQVQGGNNKALSFGQSRARETQTGDKKNRVTFKEVAGVKEAKQELIEVIEFLKNPRRFTSLGAKIPKGVLLIGPPGTGKTLLAKAVAGEANVPFFHISGSEFVEMFVGVGASRVRDLFKRAKKTAPCIIFIDEIDAVGRQRGAGLGGSHDEREQTLNQILVEMDGFETDTSVIVMAATNRPDVLDPALLRPGRFDRRVILDEPDINDREAILKVHVATKPLAEDVNLRRVAERTPGFSGADLSNLLNEAAILTVRRNKKKITTSELLESIEKVMLGPERRSRVLSEHEKKVTAYHEAGHALVSHELPKSDPVRKISIISRGMAAGYTLKFPSEDKHLRSRSEFLAELAVLLAGWATEKEVFKEVTTGATNDLRQATKLARKLVTTFGMSELLGPRTFGEKDDLIFLGREITEQRDYSEKIATQIDQEVAKFLKTALETAKNIIIKTKPKLEEIVKQLLDKETLEQAEFEAIFKMS